MASPTSTRRAKTKEIEIKEMNKMTEKHEQQDFMIESDILEQLRPRINKVVSLIKQAIDAKRPIWIRHHSDTDGYCGAIALERAILPLIYDRHTKERDQFYHYARLPSKTPYYDYADATKDVCNFMNRVNKFESKEPMIIICDTGSSEQDIMAIKKAKVYGAKIIVIDHHPACKETEKIVEAFVNPHLVGSTYDFSAGMICAEIGKMLNPKVHGMEFIAAVAGIGDKVTGKEIDAYLELCRQKEIGTGLIRDTAECMDFEGFMLGFTEGRDIANDLLGGDAETQKKMLEIIKPEVEKIKAQQLETNKKYMQIKEHGHIVICKLNVSKVRSYGAFPPSGKTTGILQNNLAEEYEGIGIEENHKKHPITLGISDDQINFRCSKQINDFDVNELLLLLKKELPHAQIDGGGHKRAGSISFVEAAKDEVLKKVDEYLHKIKG